MLKRPGVLNEAWFQPAQWEGALQSQKIIKRQVRVRVTPFVFDIQWQHAVHRPRNPLVSPSRAASAADLKGPPGVLGILWGFLVRLRLV